MPSKPLNKQYHKVELKLPDGFLDQFAPFPKSKVTGAAIAAAGAYMGIHILVTFGRNVAGAAAAAFRGPLPTGGQPGLAAINFFISIFSGDAAAKPLTVPVEWTEFDPYAFATALTVGGLVLAGINPGQVLIGFGEIVQGVGEIIPG